MITLRTTVEVTHADVTKVLTGGTRQGIVEMRISGFAYTSLGGVEVPFSYVDDLENKLPVQEKTYTDENNEVTHIVKSNGVFIVPSNRVKPITQSVNALSPVVDNLEDYILARIQVIATIEMSKSFSILAEEIEKV